jgi:hypothetical protein
MTTARRLMAVVLSTYFMIESIVPVGLDEAWFEELELGVLYKLVVDWRDYW